jgi:hypothetical protein
MGEPREEDVIQTLYRGTHCLGDRRMAMAVNITPPAGDRIIIGLAAIIV